MSDMLFNTTMLPAAVVFLFGMLFLSSCLRARGLGHMCNTFLPCSPFQMQCNAWMLAVGWCHSPCKWSCIALQQAMCQQGHATNRLCKMGTTVNILAALGTAIPAKQTLDETVSVSVLASVEAMLTLVAGRPPHGVQKVPCQANVPCSPCFVCQGCPFQHPGQRRAGCC